MTGLVADLVALRNAVGEKSENDALDELANQVATTCWNNPTAYHGCSTFALECLKDDLVNVQCEALFNKAKENQDIQHWLESICKENKRQECDERF